MDDDRLTKCAFNAEYEINQNNWCQDVKHVMSCLGFSNHYENKSVCLSNANDRMHAYYSNIWSRDIRQIFIFLFVHCFERVVQLTSKLFYRVALHK